MFTVRISQALPIAVEHTVLQGISMAGVWAAIAV